ncbi:MAG: exodeoxyribonuclease VII large subunit [Phycisphaeraceae bacterium]|nr:exodeoxyribonuclease VII large subunit [Phycisphaeraceae bacterium]
MARRPFDAQLAFGGLFPDPARPPVPPAAPSPAPVNPPPAPDAPPAPAIERPEDPSAANSEREPRDLSVTAAAKLVDDALASIARPIRIVGQVSGLSTRTHWYFNLKDESSVIQCVLWKTRASRAQEIREGDEVRVTGTFSFYAPSGKTSFIVERIEPRGLGALEARFRALCEELRAKGWFDDDRKPPLPLLPRRIAIITSRAGAALRDCLATAAARCPSVGILVVDVPVQGEGAALEVARAIHRVDHAASRLGIDAILVTRGGGSREDLWAFNERVVAEAAFACRTPLVAAIGHEPDIEVIELVAHRAATPTRGITLLLPDRRALLDQIAHWRVRVDRAVRRQLSAERESLRGLARSTFVRRPREALIDRRRESLAVVRRDLSDAIRDFLRVERERLLLSERRLERSSPRARHTAARERLAQLRGRADRAIRSALSRKRGELTSVRRHLEGIGPEQVLARGYSITTDPNGRVVRDAASVRPGVVIRTRLATGSLFSEVQRGVPPGDDGVA